MQPNPNESLRQESMPQVRFTGQGINVNGAWVDGDVITAWVRFAADRGYVIKIDRAIGMGLDRTEDRDMRHVGLFDAVTNLIEIAGKSAL